MQSDRSNLIILLFMAHILSFLWQYN